MQFLDISFNALTSLPSHLSALVSLTALNAAFNPFGKELGGSFPNVVFSLPALRELNLDYCGCFRIGPAFGKLRDLESLQARSSSATMTATQQMRTVRVCVASQLRVSVAALLELTELAKPVEMPCLCCNTQQMPPFRSSRMACCCLLQRRHLNQQQAPAGS